MGKGERRKRVADPGKESKREEKGSKGVQRLLGGQK